MNGHAHLEIRNMHTQTHHHKTDRRHATMCVCVCVCVCVCERGRVGGERVVAMVTGCGVMSGRGGRGRGRKGTANRGALTGRSAGRVVETPVAVHLPSAAAYNYFSD